MPPLGGLHMLMSFYGSVKTITSVSGIDRLFQNIYGENSVRHILIGNAVSRANRTHILTESALMIILQEFHWHKMTRVLIGEI